MVNIWEFILQTISVSLVASLLLVTKSIFKDKLTPRWQYWIWILLVLRIFLPVRADKLVVLPFGVYLEMLKTYVESRLGSAYTHPLTATEPESVIPYITSAPKSITDFLFIIYIIGIVACLCFYLFSYIKLRLILKKGHEVSLENKGALQRSLSESKLGNIKVISVEGINSAFICGVLSPVLVLPFGRETDEKVLLHEIMHLKHLDSLQNIFWCVLRCLHWCNPFMHYVFNIIGNEMEMLCDQRVLENLEGEERREYGVLLLNEVNKKYARMPGTTSVSNGGKNISKRIEAIVRFKKYPKGMALVSVCIAVILSLPCLFVSAGFSADNDIYFPDTEYKYQKALVYSRINRCTTVAGAIDTYAKALMDNSGIMLLTVSPTEKHEEIIKDLHDFYKTEEEINIIIPSGGRPFTVFNLIKANEEKYSAVLVFSTVEEDENEGAEDEYHVYGDTLFVPIEVFKENNSWVVRETGKRKKSKNHLEDSVLMQVHSLKNDVPILFETVQQGEKGSLTVKTTTVYQTDYGVVASENMSFFTDSIGYDNKVHLNADFSGCFIETSYIYNYEGKDYKKVEHVAMEYTEDLDTEFTTEKHYLVKDYGSSSTDGTGKRAYTVNDREEWDRTVIDSDMNSNLDYKKLMEGYKSTRKLAIYVDGKLADVFTAEVNINGD